MYLKPFEIQGLDWSLEKLHLVYVFPNFPPQPQLQLHTICDELFSLLEQPSQLPVQGSFWDSLCHSMNALLLFTSRSHFNLDTEKIVDATDSLSKFASSFLVLGNLPTWPSHSISWGLETEKWSTADCFDFAAAACFRTRYSLRAGWDHCEVVRAHGLRIDIEIREGEEIGVLGLITCAGRWSGKIGQSPPLWRSALLWVPTSPSYTLVWWTADRRHLKHGHGTTQMDECAEVWTFLQRHTWDVSHGIARCNVDKKMCAVSMRGWVLYVQHPVALRMWRLAERETPFKENRKALSCSRSWTSFLCRYFHHFRDAWFIVLLRTRQLFPTFCPVMILPTMLMPSLPVRRPWLWSPTRMLKTSEKRKMRLVVRVLLWSVQPNECSATQDVLVVRDRFYRVLVSAHLLGYNVLTKSFLEFFNVSIRTFFASWYPGRWVKGSPYFSSIALRRNNRFSFPSLLLRRCVWDINFRNSPNIWPKHLWPIMRQLGLPVNFVVLPSVPNWCMICVSFSHLVEYQLPFCDVLAISWVHVCILFELRFEVRKNGAFKNSKKPSWYDVSSPEWAWWACRMSREAFLEKRGVNRMGVEFLSLIQWVPYCPSRK